jgi:hypothetical protein
LSTHFDSTFDWILTFSSIKVVIENLSCWKSFKWILHIFIVQAQFFLRNILKIYLDVERHQSQAWQFKIYLNQFITIWFHDYNQSTIYHLCINENYTMSIITNVVIQIIIWNITCQTMLVLRNVKSILNIILKSSFKSI